MISVNPAKLYDKQFELKLSFFIDIYMIYKHTKKPNIKSERSRHHIYFEQVLSKSKPKTPYELIYWRKHSLRHFHVWYYKAEEKLYIPSIKKLNSKQSLGILLVIVVTQEVACFTIQLDTKVIKLDSLLF